MKVLVVYAHPNPKSFTHAILEEFTKGLADGGHTYEIDDLYAIGFNPVYNMQDYVFFSHESVPRELLEAGNPREKVLDNVGTGLFGSIKKAIAKRKMQDVDLMDIVKAIGQFKPKDVVAEQAKVSRADAIAFIAPNFWMHFPAILKGWMTRVFSYGFAYTLTHEGWRGDAEERIPLLKLQKALIIQPAFFSEENYRSKGFGEAMRKTIDTWSLEYVGIPDVQHVFFHSIFGVSEKTLREYLQEAYRLGKEF